MEKVKIWWQKRTLRDRRAIMVLGIVLPIILFWYLVTVPMQDRLALARRVLETKREEAVQVQKLLKEYSLLKSQLDGVEFKASPSVVTELESAFDRLEQNRPLLNRTSLMIFGQSQPAAQVRITSAPARDFWNILSLIASSGVYIADLEINSSAEQHRFSAAIKAWLPDE